MVVDRDHVRFGGEDWVGCAFEKDRLRKRDPIVRRARRRRLNLELVVKPGRPVELEAHLVDHEDKALCLEILESEPMLREDVGSCALAVLQIVRVINDALGIGVFEVDSNR